MCCSVHFNDMYRPNNIYDVIKSCPNYHNYYRVNKYNIILSLTKNVNFYHHIIFSENIYAVFYAQCSLTLVSLVYLLNFIHQRYRFSSIKQNSVTIICHRHHLLSSFVVVSRRHIPSLVIVVCRCRQPMSSVIVICHCLPL